jgi:hypothetical protein
VAALVPEYVLPRPVDSSAPPTQFSSARALQSLKTIAAAPHPLGTEAHGAVNQYLRGELSGLGLTVDEQRTTYVDVNRYGDVMAGRVRNLLATKPGSHSTKTVLLVAHYDSPITSPGAADDGAGVATLLETARALSVGPALRNDVQFLFTDAEEIGLYGAKAFRRDHPAFKQVGIVLNFEARGTEGPSTMFETGRRSGPVVEAMRAVVATPYASSLAPSLYELMGNNTDFTVFKNANLPGLNFAFAHNWPRYHSQMDTVAQLDPRSLQHHGSYALALARHFGDADLNQLPRGDHIYFNLLGPWMVMYAAWWAIPLAIIATLGYVVLVVMAFRRGQLRALRFAGALFLLPAITIVAGLLARLYLTRFVGDIQGGLLMYRESYYLLACVLLAALATASIALAFARWIDGEHLLIGTLAWWVVLTCASAIMMPGASYVFVWPLLIMLAAAWVRQQHGWQMSRGRRLAVFYLAPLAAALFLVPPGTMLTTALIASNAYLIGIYAAIGLTLLIPHLTSLPARHRWVWPATLAGAVVVVTAAMYRGPVYDAEHPQMDQIVYFARPDSDPLWVAPTRGVSPWMASLMTSKNGTGNALPDWFSSGLSRAGGFHSAIAPAAAIALPDATIVKDQQDGDRRTLTLHIVSPRRAPKLAVRVSPGPITLVDVNGQALEVESTGRRGGAAARDVAVVRKDALVVYQLGPADEGMQLTISTKPGPITLEILDLSYDLPASVRQAIAPRPNSIIPLMSTGDATVGQRVRTF